MNKQLDLTVRLKANKDGSFKVISQGSKTVKQFGANARSAGKNIRGLGRDSIASSRDTKALFNSINGLERGINSLNSRIDTLSTRTQRQSRSNQTLISSFGGLRGVIGTLGLVTLSRNLFKTTGVVQDLDVRIKSLTKVAGDYDAVQHFIIQTADKQHKSIAALSDGYAKLRLLQNGNVISSKQTKSIMIGLNDAASALGATNAQLNQVYFGLAQGLSAAKLQAQEFDQVMEPLPGLAQAMGRAIAGTGDVVAGSFRKMVIDGKITSEIFSKTLVEALQDFEGQAALTGDNVNAKINDIKNEWFKLVAALNEQGTIPRLLNLVLDTADLALGQLALLAESDKAESVRYLTEFKSRVDDAAKSVDDAAKVYQKMMGTFGSGEALNKAIQDQSKYKSALAHTIKEAKSFGVSQEVINRILFEGETATETFTRQWDDLSKTYEDGTIKQDEYQKSLRTLVDTLNDVSAGGGVSAIEASVKKITEALDKDIKKLSMSGREYFIWSNQLEKIDPLLKTNVLRLYDQKSALQQASKAQDQYMRQHKEVNRELEANNKLLEKINTLAAPKKSTEKIDFSSVGSGALDAITAQAEDNIDVLQRQKQAIADIANANQFSEQVNKAVIASQKGINVEIAKHIDVSKASTDEIAKRAAAQKQALQEMGYIDDVVVQFDIEALDLGDFGGLAGDINSIAMAFDSMSSSLATNADFIQQNKQAWDAYTASTVDVGKDRSKNIEKFAKREQALIRQTTQIQLQGSSDMLGGVSNMLNSMAALQDEGSKKQIQYQKAAMVVEGAAAVVKGVSAVMTALQGDPYTAIPRAVLTAGIVAVQLAQIGQSYSAVSGGSSTPELQKTQGTGTVLGDPTAVSESLGNSMEHLEDLADLELTYSSKMLQSLINIDNNTRSIAIGLGRSDQYNKFTSDPLLYNNVTAPNQNGYSNAAQTIGHEMDIGGLFGPVVDFLFASGREVADSGIKFNPAQTIADVFNEGLESEYYAIVNTWDKFFGFKTDTNTSIETSEIEGEISQWFTSMAVNVADAVLDGVTVLREDVSFDELKQQIMDLPVGLDFLSLKDMTIPEMEEAISGVFSKYADTIATELMPGLEKFQQVGEGMFETGLFNANKTI